MDNKEEILKKLNSENQELVREALEEIKTGGNLTLVPDLFDALCVARDYHIIHQITSMLADIRETGFRQKMIEAIQESEDSAFRAKLLRVCWESSLDYSEHALLFARIFVEDEFDAAFEALTLLEEQNSFTEEQKLAIGQLLKEYALDEKKSISAESLLSDIQ